jgi:peptide/nickel transport system permease protein
MLQYIIRRLLVLVPLLIGVTVITFTMIRLVPGDPVAAQYGANPEEMDPEVVERLREELGLNDPLPVQFARYVGHLIRGDLGRSITTKRPVGPDIVQRFPATMLLAVSAIAVVLLVSIPLGIISALKRGSLLDSVVMTISLFGVSMPNFWIGVVLILIFALRLDWLPSVGRGEGVVGTIKSLILPAVTLGTSMAGLVTRITRSSMLEVLGQDYMRTAHAKGLQRRVVLVRHGLRNALIPVVTILGLQFASLLGGTVIVETIFAWPGMGRFAVNAIWRRDYPVIMGTVLVFAVIFMLVNLVTDVLYTFLDPRIRYD